MDLLVLCLLLFHKLLQFFSTGPLLFGFVNFFFLHQENIDVDSEGEMYNDDNDPSSSNAVPATNSGAGPLVTEFRKEMFQVSDQNFLFSQLF